MPEDYSLIPEKGSNLHIINGLAPLPWERGWGEVTAMGFKTNRVIRHLSYPLLR